MTVAIVLIFLASGLVGMFWLLWSRLPAEPRTSYDHGIPRAPYAPEVRAEPRKAA